MRFTPASLVVPLILASSCAPGTMEGGYFKPVTISIQGPTVVHTNKSVTLTIEADGWPDRVELLTDGLVLAELTEPYTFVWDTTNTPEATYAVTARALRAGDASTVESDTVAVVVDRTPPAVLERRPLESANDVWVGDPIEIVFSEPLAFETVTETSVLLAGAGSVNIAKTMTLSNDGRVLQIKPLAPLAAPERITVSIARTVLDLAGNYAVPDDWSWTVPTWYRTGPPLDLAGEKRAWFPSAAVDSSGMPLVAWAEDRDGSYDIYVKRFDGAQWDILGGALDAGVANDAWDPALALSGDDPMVAWYEYDGTSFNVFVKQWNGASWTPLGAALDVVGGAHAAGIRMAVDAQGFPVVAWHEYSQLDSATVQVARWDGDTWNRLGARVDFGVAPAIALDPQGSPIVTYYVCTDGFECSSPVTYASRWNGSSWSKLGNRLAFDAYGAEVSGDLAAWSENGRVHTARWDGSTWSELAPATPGTQPFLSRANGSPVLAFTELTGTLRVSSWNGAAWEPMDEGALNVSGGYAFSPSIAFNGEHAVLAWDESTDVHVRRLNR